MTHNSGPQQSLKTSDSLRLNVDDKQLGMDQNPLEVAPDTLLRDVVVKMSQASSACTLVSIEASGQADLRCSYALVMDQQALLGILTERDVVKLTAEGICFAETPVRQVMTSQVITLKASLISDAFTPLNLLRQHHIRHLPVINEQDEVCGVFTLAKLRQSIPASALLKGRQVHEVMATSVIQVALETPVIEVAKLMAFHRVSCIIIHASETSTPLGIITEYDIVQLQRLELNLEDLVAETVMSSPLVCLHPEELLWDVQEKMQQLHVRRLVVVDNRGTLVGLVTQTGILSVLDPKEMSSTIEILQQQVEKLKDERVKLLQERNETLETQMRSTESSLLAWQEQCRATFEQAAVGIALLNLDAQFIAFNHRFCQILGYQSTDLLQRHFAGVSHPEDIEISLEEISQLLKGNQTSFSGEKRYLRPDGSLLWCNVTVSVATKPSGSPDYLIAVFEDICDRKSLEVKLRNSEHQMRSAIEAMHDLVLVCTVQDSMITGIDIAPTIPQHYEYRIGDLAGQTLQYLWDGAEDAPGQHIQQVLATGEAVKFWYSLSVNDHELYFLANISPMSDQTVLWVARDITELKQTEKALSQEKELAQVTLHSIGDAVITTDVEGNIYQFNPVAEELTGWQTTEAQGQPLSEVFNIVHEETRQPAENPIQKALREGRVVGLANHTVLISRDGIEYAIEDSAAPIRDRDGHVIGAVMVFHDVTHSRNLTRQLSWQASHDPLTRLANRRKFDQVLLTAKQSTQLDHHHHVLCFLDLDQFKVINDTCGHAAGDELLCQVSTLLKKSIRTTDTLARLGGDEFAILLCQCPLERAIAIAENLRQIVHNLRFQWSDRIFSIGVSIGLVKFDQNSPDLEDLLGAADAACYAAKTKGRNRIQVYQDNDVTLIQQRGEQQWSVYVKQALQDNRFCLYGQTIVPTSQSSGARDSACEILLRMINEQNEVIPAGVFIPAAERYDLISEIDRWVIHKFLSDYYPHQQNLAERNTLPTQYMINLSGASVGDEKFLQFLRQQLDQNPGAAQQICFEITETAAVSNLNQAVDFIKELKQLGCKFALDDFGAGMSSFAYLKTLPVDYLKIDGRFIEDMVDDPATVAIVESINHIGHVMGLPTIAEFVSSDAIREKLLDIGVDYVQGFNISLPQELNLQS